MIRVSLKYRIAGTIIAMQAMVVSVVLWQTTTLSIRASEEQQIVHEEITINPLADMARIALLTDEFSEVQSYFQKVADNKDIIHIVLVDLRNRIVASTKASELGGSLQSLPAQDQLIWRTRDVGNTSEKMGLLAVEFSHAAMLNSNHETLKRGVSLALVGMTIIAIIGILLGHLLTRRLDVLAKTAQRIAGGDLSALTGLDDNDEIGEVGRAFDHMARTVETKIEEIRESRESFALAVSGTNDGIWDWNAVTNSIVVSPHLLTMLGCSANEDSGFSIESWKERIHPEDRDETLRKFENYQKSDDEFFVAEHRIKKRSGEYFWGAVHGKALRTASGRVTRMAGSLKDITDRKHQEQAIKHQALHDNLTDLPNRTLFHDRLKVAMLVSDRENKPLSILMLDLDRFKEINDTLGHHIGDLVLQEVSRRLTRVLRATDTVSRFGGDEFMVLLNGVNVEQALHVVSKIRGAFESGFSAEGHSLHIEASIGITTYPEHGGDANTLIRRADVAMYAAKTNGTGFSVYDIGADSHTPARLSLISELRHAIESRQLILHYQPKIDLKTGSVYGVEALVRWPHPEKGLIPPTEFIPLAESCGLIHPLTDFVLETALRAHYQWRLVGVELITGINLSVRNLQDLDFPDRIAASLKAWQIEPRWLELEITESVIMNDPQRALKILTRLDEMGVRLAIDDFGTGYSSLSYLKRLPVDEVKIDRSFVMDMMKDESNAVIVRSTIDLGHNLGMKVVAEGVETLECLNFLKALGCDGSQGYYISRPLESEAFLDWLKQWSSQSHVKETLRLV